MKKLTLPVALALALGAGATGALAQGTTGQQSSSPKTQDQMGSSTTQLHAMSQSKLSQALKQAGFTDVQVVDASYMVHAKTSDGEPVVMVINPPSVSAATGSGTGTGGTTGSTGGGTQGQTGSSMPSATDNNTTTGGSGSSSSAPSTK